MRGGPSKRIIWFLRTVVANFVEIRKGEVRRKPFYDLG
jgi:hypothetical protein